MDIRTKLALALVSTSLVAMWLLGAFAYQTTFELLREDSERQLESLAESKRRDLGKVVHAWRDRIELIRSRTRLRALVAALDEVPDPARADEIRDILGDAMSSVAGVDRISLFDRRGRPVLTVGESPAPLAPIEAALTQPEAVHFVATDVLRGDRVVVRFEAALVRDGVPIGAIEVVIHAEDLLSVTGDYTGLGETGEAVVAVNAPIGATAVVLTPLRREPHLRRASLDRHQCLDEALAGREVVLRVEAHGTSGEPVLCATRSLPEVGWGLVVKRDEAEEQARAFWLRDQLVDLGLAVGAVAILAGTLLGIRLGKPLRRLTEEVERIRAGETNLRADESSSDEVGFLAQAVNDLLDAQRKR